MGSVDGDAPDLEVARLSFLDAYHQRRSQHERVLTQILALFEEYRRTKETQPKQRVHSVRGRLKGAASLVKKALAAKSDGTRALDPASVFVEITDIVGVRLVCNTLEGKDAACRWLEEEGASARRLFAIRDIRNRNYESGYRSQHYLINLVQAEWPALRFDKSDNDETVVIEVQVRTILEEAWGETEHDLVYKTASDDPTKDDVLRSGFVALSHRLHDADILVQGLLKRVADVRPPGMLVAKQQRSLELDPRHLGVHAASQDDLGASLKAAEDQRLAGHHTAALETHSQLRADVRFASPRAQQVLLSEMALDVVMQAETVLNQEHDREKADALFEQAYQLYHRAAAADPEGNPVIVLWRQARIRANQGRLPEARDLYQHALEAYERHGKPAYIRTPFYKAAIKARLGETLRDEATRTAAPTVDSDRSESLLREAKSLLMGAVGDQRDAAPKDGVPPREWMLDALLAHNNLAWFELKHGRLEDAVDVVRRARVVVDAAIWEQDLHFLDTMLSIELERLRNSPSPTFEELTWLDSLRIRILNILSIPGTYVSTDDAQKIIDNIRRCEEQWRDFVSRRFGGTPNAAGSAAVAPAGDGSSSP